MIETKQQQLTENELFTVESLYMFSLAKDIRLKPLHHLDTNTMLMACRAYDNTGFMFATPKNIARIDDAENKRVKFLIADSCYSYTFSYETGNVGIYKSGIALFYSCNPAALIQFYLQNKVAIPLYFEEGHWANGKTAIDLGIAKPDHAYLKELLKEKFDGDVQAIDEWFFDQKLHGNDLDNLEVLDNFINELK